MERSAHTPPGPPVVGNVPTFADDPLRFLTGVQEAYGGQYPLVALDPPVGPTLYAVTDAGLVHEILADRERFGRPSGSGDRRREGLLSSEGRLWEQQRSVLEPEFVGRNLGEYVDVAGRTVDEAVDAWPAEGEIDLQSELSLVTMRVITRSLFSQDTSREQCATVAEALERLAAEFQPSATDFLLPERLQPGPSEAFEEADALLDEVATEFVESHRRRDDPPEDMITALMAAQEDPEVELADDELVDETVLFMTAGQETTSLTLTYAFYWLTQYPAARQRLREEAVAVLDGDVPAWGDLAELTYTERVVRETLRLTPAAWNITREAREPTTVAGADLDGGDQLLMSTYAHHRDSRAWDDPGTFDPDRWDGDASRGDDSYFPFGSGPRICIGRQIALTEAQFALAHVLQHYDVEVLTEDLDLQPGVTLRPGNPVRARVTALG